MNTSNLSSGILSMILKKIHHFFFYTSGNRLPFLLTLLLIDCIYASSIYSRQKIKDSEDIPFWYTAPASDWKSAIPIGNVRIGGMIFGEIKYEHILLNESSIWCGPPFPVDNPHGPELISRMRELLFAGKPTEAEEICNKEFLNPETGDKRSYQPLGFLHITHDISESVNNYQRSLDYTSAISTVHFDKNGVEYLREAFVSTPAQVLVVRYTASKSGKISFTVSPDRPSGATVTTEGSNKLRISGQAFDLEGNHKGAKFDAFLQVLNDGGKVTSIDNHLKISAANSVTLLVAVATDYNFKNPGLPLTSNRVTDCKQQLTAASTKSYVQLKSDHIAGYQKLYYSSTLSIPALSKSRTPIDQRISAAAGGAYNPGLLMVYYDYCRYVIVSASRNGGIPMNLQGIWNPLMADPWRSNWHLNINVQEAYWFAEQGNLGECHEPMFSLCEGLSLNGEATALVRLGTKRGFAAGHRTDGWLSTAPEGGSPLWGMYFAGGAWCAQHMMEHYRFTQDREFLAKRALPVLRGAALFWMDWLLPNPKTGLLVSGPATSPENKYRLPDGKTASISMGPSHDQEIAWCSLSDYLEACSVLGIKNEETREVQRTLNRLALPEIAPDGRLMEWPENYIETEEGHRHLSHLWGMMPGYRISLDSTPKLAEAVSKSIDYRLSRDYYSQGWSLGWVAFMMARLKEGDGSLNMLTHEYFGKAYPNMFVDAHNCVQVGDMMGVPLAMIELLLQSQNGYLVVLPALPSVGKMEKKPVFAPWRFCC